MRVEGWSRDKADGNTGIRPFTFFEKGIVGHVGFADPFDEKIAKVRRSTTSQGRIGADGCLRLSENAAMLSQVKG